MNNFRAMNKIRDRMRNERIRAINKIRNEITMRWYGSMKRISEGKMISGMCV